MRLRRLSTLAPAIAALAVVTMTACGTDSGSEATADGPTVDTMFGDVAAVTEDDAEASALTRSTSNR